MLDVEYDALRGTLGKARTEAFRVFAERRRGADGKFVYAICPFYDLQASRCGIYEHRPFSCRTYGHYRPVNTRLPEGCVYEGHVKDLEKGAYFREVPLARELRDLQRKFDAIRPQAVGRITDVTDDILRKLRESLDPNDAEDMSVLAHAEGRHEDALALIERAARERPDDAFVQMSLGNVLDALKRPAEAQAAYERSLALDAVNPRAWVHIGFCRFELGDVGGARDAFGAAVALQPEDATSRGFLGYLSLALARSMEEVREACGHLQAAVGLDPHNAVFRVRLAESLLMQGMAAEAMPHLLTAEQGGAATAVAQVRARFAAVLDTRQPL